MEPISMYIAKKVEHRPCLYDPKNSNSACKAYKAAAYLEIAMKLHLKFENIREAYETPEDCGKFIKIGIR